MKKIRKGRIAIIAIILLSGAISAGFLVVQENRDFRIGKNLDIFFSMYRELNAFYVDDVDPDKVIKAGIDNMLRTLDPYTVYYPESESDEVDFMTTGKYGGIGALVRGTENYAVVSEVYKGFPADLAGLKAGDIIKKVNDESLKGFTTDKVSDRLKGNPGTEINVTVERSGTETKFSMKREKISILPVPYYGMITPETGYIRFTSFTEDGIEDVRNALVALQAGSAKQVILDLRSNPGGLLDEAVDIVNLFVGAGNEVVSTKGKVKQSNESFKTTKAAIDEKMPLAVLINRGSASAAEIVAGAIQDLDRGVVLGQRSYGKGLVQVVRPLSYNARLKVTTAKYYIPSGRCIQALDYSNLNEDGSVGAIPDSLISEFKTRNGRTVKDGGGITPDIEIVQPILSQFSAELYVRNYIFDYATDYYWKNQNITQPGQLSFNEPLITDFLGYLKKRNFSYKTLSEQSLAELVTNAKKEKYYDLQKDLFTELESKLSHNLEIDLALNKAEITELLDQEITGRYFYEEGSIVTSLKYDDVVKKAVEVLNNKAMYDSILKGVSN